MATDYPKTVKRYLVVGEVVHRLYETEDGHHRTHCGLITREGEIVRAKRAPNYGKLCRVCCDAVQKATYICGDGDGTPYRPVKTKGRRTSGSRRHIA